MSASRITPFKNIATTAIKCQANYDKCWNVLEEMYLDGSTRKEF